MPGRPPVNCNGDIFDRISWTIHDEEYGPAIFHRILRLHCQLLAGSWECREVFLEEEVPDAEKITFQINFPIQPIHQHRENLRIRIRSQRREKSIKLEVMQA